METSFLRKATDDTPSIEFNRESNKFAITGRSLPEDAFNFYEPAANWMRSYAKEANASSELLISLDYFNSSTVKQLLTLFSLFEEINKSGKQAKIIWCYAEGDDLMEIKGEEFQSMLDLPFELRIC